MLKPMAAYREGYLVRFAWLSWGVVYLDRYLSTQDCGFSGVVETDDDYFEFLFPPESREDISKEVAHEGCVLFIFDL